MPKKKRLSRSEITRLRSGKTKRLHGEFFSLTMSEHAELSGSKFACTVAKKVIPRAVDRNRLKRQCREAIRAHLSPSLRGSFIFLVKRSAREASFHDIEQDVERLLKSIRGGSKAVQ